MPAVAHSRRLVERVIETDPVIKRGLQRGIINSRALARFIQSRDGIGASTDSILGIIRRYPLTREEAPEHHEIFRQCEIVMRSRVGDLALENGPQVMRRISEFAGSVKSTRGESLRVVVGLRSARVIADQKALDRFRKAFSDKEIIRYCENLVEISVLMPPVAERTKGVHAKIAGELALNDVNLLGVMCCSPESILLVSEKDAPKALQALQRMVSEES